MQAATFLLTPQKEASLFFRNPTSWLVLSATIGAVALLVYTIVLNQIAMIVMAALCLAGFAHTIYLQVKVVRLATLSEVNQQMASQVNTLATNTGLLTEERRKFAQLQAAFDESNRDHQEKIEALLAQLKEKSTSLEASLVRSEELLKSIAEIQKERTKWESFAKEAQAKLIRFEEANQRLSIDLETLQNQKVQLQTQNETLSKLQAQFALENDRLKEGRQGLQKTLETLQHELAAKRDLQPLIDTAEKLEESTTKFDDALKRAEELQKRADADIEELSKISLSHHKNEKGST